MNYKLLVDTAVLAGEIMIAGGAETYRVEDTISRILRTSKLERCEVFVVSTGIVVTLDDPSIDAISLVRKVEERTTNLGNISAVNDISRKLCNEVVTIDEAFQALIVLKDQRRYKDSLRYGCTILTAASFSALLGATPMECILTAVNGLFIVFSMMLNKKVRINRFVSNMVVSAMIALTTTLFYQMPGITIEIEPVIAGSIMALLPGVAITNAIRDTLQGDYMSGSARVIEAFVIAASLAVGIGAGLALGRMLFSVIV